MKTIEKSNLAITVVFLLTACGGGSAVTEKPAYKENLLVHNGTTYGTVISPYTGKVWLDRNLGAAQVCTSFDDVACYGDYYQWGRNFDGHQDSLSATTANQAIDVNSAGKDFITANGSYSLDWAKIVDTNASLRLTNWSKIDGSSICPVNFRVPTIIELRAELLYGGASIRNRDDAFNSFLKLPSAGKRYIDGVFQSEGSYGYLWSSSTSTYSSWDLHFLDTSAWNNGSYRASGKSVRCIRD